MVQISGYKQDDFNYHKTSRKSWIFITAFLSILTLIGFALGTSSKKIDIAGEPAPFWQKVAGIFVLSEKEDPDYIMPTKEPNSLDILILGVRGEDDPNAKN